jgi:hypothetical protein
MINKRVAEEKKDDKETIGGPAGSVVGRGASAVGGALKTVGTAFKKDIFKNAGEIEGVVDAVWDNLTQDPEFMRRHGKMKEKLDKAKNIKEVLIIVNNDPNGSFDCLVAMMKQNYKKFQNDRKAARGKLKAFLYKGGEGHNLLNKKEQKDIDQLIEKVLDAAFPNTIQKPAPPKPNPVPPKPNPVPPKPNPVPPKPNPVPPNPVVNNPPKPKFIPEERNMTFKSFFEAENIKETEDIQKLDAEVNKDKQKLADTQVKKAQAIQKVTKDNIKKSTNKKEENPLAEGVYAGADGINKKIPFTQDPLLKKAEDSKEKEDPIKDAGEERRKKLERITKELQELANEVSSDVNPNINEEPPLSVLAAKEKFSLDEAAHQWEQMQCAMGECGVESQLPVEITAQSMIDSGEFNNAGLEQSETTAQVADRASIYGFIKSNNLTGIPRDQSLNILLGQFGNSSTELSQILSDAILSDGEPSDIDGSYGYTDSLRQIIAPKVEPVQVDWDNSERSDLNRLQDTWKDMEAKFNLKDL